MKHPSRRHSVRQTTLERVAPRPRTRRVITADDEAIRERIARRLDPTDHHRLMGVIARYDSADDYATTPRAIWRQGVRLAPAIADVILVELGEKAGVR